MDEKKKKEGAVRISLVDVLYGVVLGYGFVYFDQATSSSDYFRFCFAYAIIMADWIYVHLLYWGWEYDKNVFFVLDVLILFVFSRLIRTSISDSVIFLRWYSALFFLYCAWDLACVLSKIPSDYDFRYSIVGDLLAGSICAAASVAVAGAMIQNDFTINVIIVVVYCLAFASWLKKVKIAKKRKKM